MSGKKFKIEYRYYEDDPNAPQGWIEYQSFFTREEALAVHQDQTTSYRMNDKMWRLIEVTEL